MHLNILIIILVLAVVLKLLKMPLDLIIKVLLNAFLGYVILLIINYFGTSFNVYIPINFFTSLFVGICGVPAVIILLIVFVLL